MNDDGATIVRIRVIYDAKQAPSVEEMEKIVDKIWPSDNDEDAPVPVIDFQEDTDIESFAAE